MAVATKTRKVRIWVVELNVLVKSTPGTCLKPWTTSLALKRSILPLGSFLISYTHLHVIGVRSGGQIVSLKVPC